MDLLLHSPLDHQHSLNAAAAAAGSLLTCLAVITAAIGLWRIRTVRSRPSVRPVEILAEPVGPTVEPAAVAPKARFTAYYSYEGAEDRNEDEEGDDGISDGGLTGPWEERDWWWEGTGIRAVRKRDRRWYLYQELTALNGNVVRFWDGDVALRWDSPRWSRQLL